MIRNRQSLQRRKQLGILLQKELPQPLLIMLPKKVPTHMQVTIMTIAVIIMIMEDIVEVEGIVEEVEGVEAEEDIVEGTVEGIVDVEVIDSYMILRFDKFDEMI